MRYILFHVIHLAVVDGLGLLLTFCLSLGRLKVVTFFSPPIRTLKKSFLSFFLWVSFSKKMNFEMAGAERRTTTWAGLALMGVQFGALARLTYEEYSWALISSNSLLPLY